MKVKINTSSLLEITGDEHISDKVARCISEVFHVEDQEPIRLADWMINNDRSFMELVDITQRLADITLVNPNKLLVELSNVIIYDQF